jgi:RasGEF domain/RasGEF N-terminal motif
MLVKIAKQLQDYVQYKESEHVVFELLNELILKGLKVVERAVRFHDIWIESENTIGLARSGTLTPPADESQTTTPGADSQMGSEIASSRQLALSQLEASEQNVQVNHSRMSTATLSQSGVMLPDAVQPSTSASHRMSKRMSVSHRLSYLNKGSAAQKQNLASERLAAAHDSFLGLLGTFIGLHINSRSSHELAVTTHQAVQACRLLIAIVEEIWARDGRRADSLQAARDVMYQKLADLVQTAKDMLSSAQNGDDVLSQDQGQQLVMTTTNCLRAAGDCVAKARQTLDRIGDFEFEANTVGLADQISEALNNRNKAAPSTFEPHHERSASSLDKPLPVPPEPTSRPPPPPTLSLNTHAKPLPEPPQLSPLFSPDTEEPKETFPESPEEESEDASQSSTTPQGTAPPTINHDVNGVSPPNTSLEFNRMPRTDSVNTSATSATDTVSSWRNSNNYGASSVSIASTRATTPDRSPVHRHNDSLMMNSIGSVSELQSVASEELANEEQVLETTFAHELIPSKDGQVLGGSLPALIERLTTHDSTPDATFVTTFFLTFRLFTTPIEFAQGLVHRFDYIGESPTVGGHVRLRVFNVFKGWLETHWQSDTDAEVMPIINDFANNKLAVILPTAATRIHDLVSKISTSGERAIVPRVVSALPLTRTTSVASFASLDGSVPAPIISKSQLSSLRSARQGGQQCSILDFDPLEVARQFTIIESRIFCSIQPEELLALEWTKKIDSRALHVRAMSTLSTDLANLVADTILQYDEPKKRAVMIKHWVKIAMKCLELNNYDSLMAIICSLNSSMVLRLKKTWELVSQKTKTRWEELCAIVHVGKNHQALRERLKNIVAPCIPFVGLYLTDLTFIHAGNQATRELPGSEPKRFVINFDRYVKTARTIGQLQRFQVPYKLAPVPELQEWIEGQIQRINESESANVQSYYRRSLRLEPRELKTAVKTHWYSTQKELPTPQVPPIPQQATVQAQQESAGAGAQSTGHSPKESMSMSGSSFKEKFDLLQALSLTKSSDPKIGSY